MGFGYFHFFLVFCGVEKIGDKRLHLFQWFFSCSWQFCCGISVAEACLSLTKKSLQRMELQTVIFSAVSCGFFGRSNMARFLGKKTHLNLDVFMKSCEVIHSPKFNMEPENDGPQKESRIPGCHFQVPCQTLGG